MNEELQVRSSVTTRVAPRLIGSMALRSRVRIAAGISVGLLVIGLALAAFMIARVGDEAAAFTERHVSYTTALNEAALNAKGIANDERGYMLSGNEEFLVEIDVRTTLAREAFAKAAAVATSAHRQRLTAVQEGFERWLVAIEEEIALYQAGDEEAAMTASLGPTREVRKAYEASLAMVSLGEGGIPNASTAVSASVGRSVAVLGAYALVATVIAIGAAVWALSRPSSEIE